MNADLEQSIRRPGGADAARVLAAFIVAWFHIWQQSWVGSSPLTVFARTGFVWVDLLILLSAFCLALPYGADRALGLPFRGTEGFYRRRLLRILPAYYFCVAVHYLIWAVQGKADEPLTEDLLAHLTLTHTFYWNSYYNTRLGAALWTVGVLAIFYLLFPRLIRLYLDHPGRVIGVLLAVQGGWTLWALRLEGRAYQMAFNQFPAFTGVLALGLAAASLYPRLVQKVQGRWKPAFLLAALGVMGLIWLLLKKTLNFAPNLQYRQLAVRMPLAVLFVLLLLLLCLGMGPSKKGRPLVWLAGISYSFYLWHQDLAVWLKKLRIPHWEGDTPPNQLGDTEWMNRYNLLCWAVALAAAVLCTYLVEKPLLKWITARRQAKKQPLTAGNR